jgi:uncharacterized membrane protein YkvI
VFKSPFFQKYLLPGFVFQSVVIAGGYGTGRELVEFFLVSGPLSGLLAMVVSMLVFSAVCAATFAFAQTFKAYDYRTLFKHLLGRGWFLYEIIYFAILLLVLAVIAAAAGSILREIFSLPYAIGVIGIMVAVGFLTFQGSAIIERFMAGWSFVLYAVYAILFVWCVARFGPRIAENLSPAANDVGLGWIWGGIRYAGYNLAVIPPILFVIRHAQTKRDAITAGGIAGPIAIIPAFFFYFCMVSQYPEILDRPVPANYLLDVLGSRAFQLTFQIVLFGTLIETGTAMIHGVNERIAAVFAERNQTMPTNIRPAIALGLLTAGALLAQFGLIDLIARGYGTMTLFFLAIYAIPIVTWGVWKITGGRDKATAAPG